ncbi:hemogen isoform X2 [Aquila chrysaetos chrysaetos]|uniref:hemogen isoform X2 n=1 Tax=Aquila chrysaetos chrysaetos TaxID=223781 RepID=UPI0005D04D35|nr:hemogen isoform X2 [Aquila chrysaetos chrysaetos]
MESLGKDLAYSDSSQPPSANREEYAVPDVSNTRRLRDREMLRKRRAEAHEKDSVQWVLRDYKIKRQRRSRGGRRGRGHQPVMEPSQEPELELDPEPNPQEEAGPMPSSPALPEPVHQLPVLTIQDLVSEMQLGASEGEQGAMIEDPVGRVGEEDLLKPAEGEIPEALNIPLENEYQDDEYSTDILF